MYEMLEKVFLHRHMVKIEVLYFLLALYIFSSRTAEKEESVFPRKACSASLNKLLEQCLTVLDDELYICSGALVKPFSAKF